MDPIGERSVHPSVLRLVVVEVVVAILFNIWGFIILIILYIEGGSIGGGVVAYSFGLTSSVESA